MSMLDQRKVFFLALFCALCVLFGGASSACAMVSAPGWGIIGRAAPTNLPPGGEGVLKLYVFNLGAGEPDGSTTLTDVLPPGLTATAANTALSGDGREAECSVLGPQLVRCKVTTSSFAARSVIVVISVNVDPGASGSAVDKATVTGGGALRPSSTSFPVTYSSDEPQPGFANFDAWLSNPDGTIDTQAGSHPYALTVAFGLNNTTYGPKLGDGTQEETVAGGGARNVNVNLPPGVVGDPEAVPQCPRQVLNAASEGAGSGCPLASQVGMNMSTIQGNELLGSEPVFNMVPPPGIAAEFAFDEGGVIVFLDSGVRTGGDNGITTHVDNIPQRSISFNYTTIWGIPADPSHDPLREGMPAGIEPKPLLSLPTSCEGQPEFSMELLGTWHDQNFVASRASAPMRESEGNPVGFTDCNLLQPFKPSISIAPDTTYADTPAGLSVEVKMPQGLNPEGLSTPGFRTPLSCCRKAS